MLTGQGPSLVSSKPWMSVHHFILPTTLGSQCCCCHRMDGETEARCGSVTCSRPHGLGSSICPEAPCQVAADTQCRSVAEGGRPAGFMCVWLARKLKDQGPYLSDPASQETSPEHTLYRPEPLLGRAGALAVGGSQPPVFLLGHLCCLAGGLE